MATVTREFTVPKRGVGRKDYSQNIERSTVPFIKTHQSRVNTWQHLDLSAYWWATIDLEPIIGTINIADLIPEILHQTHMLYKMNLEFDDNVLIKAYFGLYNINTDELDAKQCKFGYGKVDFKFPKGYLVPQETILDEIYPTIGFLPGGYTITYSALYVMDTEP